MIKHTQAIRRLLRNVGNNPQKISPYSLFFKEKSFLRQNGPEMDPE